MRNSQRKQQLERSIAAAGTSDLAILLEEYLSLMMESTTNKWLQASGEEAIALRGEMKTWVQLKKVLGRGYVPQFVDNVESLR